ncbi:MAG: hypothetical protein L6R28_14575 [Planctomycetes bacterium]|nr:hypothetical protein [Planctomycetota bacterium]
MTQDRVQPRRRPRAWLPALGLVVLAAGLACAGPVAQVLRLRCAPIHSEPGFEKGATTDTAYLGQRLEVIDRKDDWRKVRYETEKVTQAEKFKEGWIHASALAEPQAGAAPASQPWVRDGAASLPRFDGEHSKAARHAEARKLKLAGILDLEQLYPSAKDLDAFLKEGKLGLYRTDWPVLAPTAAAKASEKSSKTEKKDEKAPEKKTAAPKDGGKQEGAK